MEMSSRFHQSFFLAELRYSVLQSDGNSFCGDVVSDFHQSFFLSETLLQCSVLQSDGNSFGGVNMASMKTAFYTKYKKSKHVRTVLKKKFMFERD